MYHDEDYLSYIPAAGEDTELEGKPKYLAAFIGFVLLVIALFVALSFMGEF